MRFFENANYNFIANRRIGYILSGILIAVSILAMAIRGLQYGIDFRGGTELVIAFDSPVSVAEVRTVLTEALQAEPQVRRFGSPSELQIRTVATDVDELTDVAGGALREAYPDNPVRIVKSDLIGPVFAKDIRNAAFTASILSMLVISIYIFIRFRTVPFMVSVLAALVHDVVILLGIFTLLEGVLPFNMEIDQILVGAFLTIIGYSLNDTIVVFDRIRENGKVYRSLPWDERVNRSINQTLSRTVVTSLTTFMVVFVLFLFGGAVLKGFSFALMAGIALGTYSTIYLACPLLIDLKIGKAAAPNFPVRPLQTAPDSAHRGATRKGGPLKKTAKI